jgi:hypothetical protein
MEAGITSIQRRPYLGWTATLAASWTLAGGVAGGVLITVLLLAGRLHPDGVLIFAGALAALGGIFGIVHGAVLGWLGRPPNEVGRLHWQERLLACGAAVAAFTVAVLLSVWFAMSAVVARNGSASGWFALAAASFVALGIFWSATMLGWHALENAYRRWPDNRLGSLLVVGAFVVLVAAFVGLRPAIPGTGLQLSMSASIALAALASLWIATPAIIVALRLMHHRS